MGKIIIKKEKEKKKSERAAEIAEGPYGTYLGIY